MGNSVWVGTVQPAEGLTGKKRFVGSLGVGTLLLLTMDITAPGLLTCELQNTQQQQISGFIDFLSSTANHALMSLALSHISSSKGPQLAWTSPSSARQFPNEYSLPSPLFVLSAGCWLEQYFYSFAQIMKTKILQWEKLWGSINRDLGVIEVYFLQTLNYLRQTQHFNRIFYSTTKNHSPEVLC